MRFGDLPRGSAFRYQGRDYLKTSPLAAAPRSGGAERLIARSALVEPLDRVEARPRPPPGDRLPRDAVQAAIEQLHDRAQHYLSAAGAAAADREALSALRDRLLGQLGLLP